MAPIAETSVLHLSLKGEEISNSIGSMFTRNTSTVIKVCAFQPAAQEVWQPVLTSSRALEEPASASAWPSWRILEQSSNQEWSPIKIACQKLCQGDLDWPVQIEVVHQDEHGEDVAQVGSFETTVSELLKRSKDTTGNARSYNLMESGRCSGRIVVAEARIEEGEFGDSSPEPATTVEEYVDTITETQSWASSTIYSELPSCAASMISTISATSTKKSIPRPPEFSTKISATQRYSEDTQEARFPLPPKGALKRGKSIQYMEPSRKMLILNLGAVNLVPLPKGFLDDATNAWYTISAFRAGNVSPFQVVYNSDTVADNLSPVWEECVIGLDELCSGNLDWPILISVYDRQNSGRDGPMGSYQTTVSEILRNQESKKGSGQSGRMTLKRGFREIGDLKVVSATIQDGSADEEAIVQDDRSWFLKTRDLVADLVDYRKHEEQVNSAVAEVTDDHGDSTRGKNISTVEDSTHGGQSAMVTETDAASAGLGSSCSGTLSNFSREWSESSFSRADGSSEFGHSDSESFDKCFDALKLHEVDAEDEPKLGGLGEGNRAVADDEKKEKANECTKSERKKVAEAVKSIRGEKENKTRKDAIGNPARPRKSKRSIAQKTLKQTLKAARRVMPDEETQKKLNRKVKRTIRGTVKAVHRVVKEGVDSKKKRGKLPVETKTLAAEPARPKGGAGDMVLSTWMTQREENVAAGAGKLDDLASIMDISYKHEEPTPSVRTTAATQKKAKCNEKPKKVTKKETKESAQRTTILTKKGLTKGVSKLPKRSRSGTKKLDYAKMLDDDSRHS